MTKLIIMTSLGLLVGGMIGSQLAHYEDKKDPIRAVAYMSMQCQELCAEYVLLDIKNICKGEQL